MYPSHLLQLCDAIRARVGNFFCCYQHLCPFIGVYCVYSIACKCGNVVLSLQGSTFMHYMPHLTHVSSTFLSLVARRSIKSKHKRRATAMALAAFRQKAPGGGGGGGGHDSHLRGGGGSG